MHQHMLWTMDLEVISPICWKLSGVDMWVFKINIPFTGRFTIVATDVKCNWTPYIWIISLRKMYWLWIYHVRYVYLYPQHWHIFHLILKFLSPPLFNKYWSSIKCEIRNIIIICYFFFIFIFLLKQVLFNKLVSFRQFTD